MFRSGSPRRTGLRTLAVMIGMGGVASSASAAAPASSAPRRCTGASVLAHDETPALREVLTPDPALWDALAKEYCAWTSAPSMEEFAIWWAYNRLMEVALGTAPPPKGIALDLSREADMKRALWVTHIMGNYQANWYWRNDHTQPEFGPPRTDLLINTIGPVFSEPGYIASSKRIKEDLELATRGSDEDVLAFNARQTRGDPLAEGTEGAGQYAGFDAVGSGDIGWLAYNLGFVKAVLTVNKPAGEPPREGQITIDPMKVEDTTYGAGDTSFLAAARKPFEAVRSGAAGAAAQQRLQAALDGAQPTDSAGSQAVPQFARGYQGWAVPTEDLSTFSARQYRLVLLDGVYINQWAQTNLLSGLAAHALQDSALGRRQIRSVALQTAWKFGYLNTLGAPDGDLPTFTFASKSAAAQACRSRRSVLIRLRVPKRFVVSKVAVVLNARTVAVKRGRARSLRVSFKGRPAGTATLQLRVTGRQGGKTRTVLDRRTYRLCGSTKPG